MPRKSAFKCYFGCNPYKGKLHHFPPSEYPYSEKFNEWKMVLRETDKEKGDKYIYNNIHICDHHFENFYITASGRLTKNAVPSLNFGLTHQATNLRDLTTYSASHTEISDNAEANCGQGSTREIVPMYKNPPANASSTVVKSQRHPFIKKGTKCSKVKYSKEYAQVKVQLLKLKEKCKNLTQQVKQAAKLSQNKAFLRAIEKLPEPAAIFANMQFTKTSIKPRGRRFTNKEKILCLTIFKQSPKAYKLMQRLFALPSIRTVQKILNSVTIKPGINEVVMQHLKKAVEKLPEEKKICTLIFDEVALTPGLYYHKTWDMIIGFEDCGQHKTNKIADHALVFMVKSLKGKYKQPVSFTFCQGTTKTAELKNLLKEVLKAVESTGLKVIATVCDQATTNVNVINSLICDTKRKYSAEGKEYKSLAFEIDGTKIFPIFDTPHLLKGLRNNLLTKDLRYIQNGEVKYAKWQHLQMLLDADPGADDMRLLNKLTESHVMKEKIPKMKVKNAAQVFSQRVSATMRYLANHDILPRECLGTADLLLIFDKLFDSFNGHSYQDSEKKFKSALKKNSPHFKLWDESLPVLRSMGFKTEKKLRDGTTSIKFEQVPSLKHWIANINVFKEMYTFLNETHQVSSLLTRNLNQDPLENFFCNIRSNGVRNTSPTCSQFTGAFKTLLVNNLTSPHSVGANCEQDDNTALKPLESLLNCEFEKEQATGTVNVGSVINEFYSSSNSNYYNSTSKEAKRYVAGYIVKKTIQKITKTCHTCRMNLVSTIPPRNTDYILERDFTRRSLNYPSEALCEFIDDVCIIIQTYLNEDPHQQHLKATIMQVAYIFCDLTQFSCVTHKANVQNFLIDSIINIVINSWCTNVNRILKGKSTVCNNNDTKIQALNYYKTHRRYK